MVYWWSSNFYCLGMFKSWFVVSHLPPPPPPPSCSILDFPRRIMGKGSPLKLNIDSGGGEESEVKVEFSTFSHDCSSVLMDDVEETPK